MTDKPTMVATRDPLTVFMFHMIDTKVPIGTVLGLIRQCRQQLKMADGIVKLEQPFGELAANLAALLRGEGP